MTVDADNAGERGAGSVPRRRRSWPLLIFVVVTVGCLAGAALIFATQWRRDLPPRAEIIPLPPRPARQHEATNTISQWVDAENRADIPALRALACANPGQSVQKWLTSLEEFGQRQGLVFPDAVTEFHDYGSRLRVTVAVRVRPLSEAQQREVQAVQDEGGFFDDEFTLGDEGGALKVCDVSMVLD